MAAERIVGERGGSLVGPTVKSMPAIDLNDSVANN